LATRSMRKRTELIFHVVTVICMRQVARGNGRFICGAAVEGASPNPNRAEAAAELAVCLQLPYYYRVGDGHAQRIAAAAGGDRRRRVRRASSVPDSCSCESGGRRHARRRPEPSLFSVAALSGRDRGAVTRRRRLADPRHPAGAEECPGGSWHGSRRSTFQRAACTPARSTFPTTISCLPPARPTPTSATMIGRRLRRGSSISRTRPRSGGVSCSPSNERSH